MNRITNPFLVYGYAGPEYFCDRKEDTQKMISALQNGRNITLMSPRRMGKTGLIKNAFHQIRLEKPEAACFYFLYNLPERLYHPLWADCCRKAGYPLSESTDHPYRLLQKLPYPILFRPTERNSASYSRFPTIAGSSHLKGDIRVSGAFRQRMLHSH